MSLLKTKLCVKCSLEKSISDFYKDSSKKEGLTTYCKECIKQDREAFRLKNKKKIKTRSKKYYNSNKEKIKKKTKTYYFNNIDTRKQYSKDYRKINSKTIKVKDRERRLKYKYGLTINDYDKMLNVQDNKCYICDRSFTKKLIPMVDHCHKTNKVRKLLCNKCNIRVGFIETTDDLNKLLKYIKEHK